MGKLLVCQLKSFTKSAQKNKASLLNQRITLVLFFCYCFNSAHSHRVCISHQPVSRQHLTGVKMPTPASSIISTWWCFSSADIRRPPLTYVICLFLSLFEGVSVTSTPPSACCRTGPSSASVNTTPLARTASAAGRASKPNPGKLVPTCQRPTEPPTAVRIRNVAVA